MQHARVLLVTVIATGVLATAAGRGTVAYFSTQVTSTTNTFSAGNLHFQIEQFNEGMTSAAQGSSGSVTTSIELNNMKPGDVVYAPLRINNAGSLDARWGITYASARISSDSGADLTGALSLAIVGDGEQGTAYTDCGNTNWSDLSKFPERIWPLTLMTAGASQHTVVDYTQQVWNRGTLDGTSHLWSGGAFDPSSQSLPLLVAATDVLCVEVTFVNGAPGTPDGDHSTVGDNAWNGDSTHTYDTNITFTMTGQPIVDGHNFVEHAASDIPNNNT